MAIDAGSDTSAAFLKDSPTLWESWQSVESIIMPEPPLDVLPVTDASDALAKPHEDLEEKNRGGITELFGESSSPDGL